MDANNSTSRIPGCVIMAAAKPVATASPTRLFPAQSPARNSIAGRVPKPEAIPATESTPGPGVMIRKKTASAKVSIGNTGSIEALLL